ncbi:MAG: zinc ribbon domain-containing protein, partial [Candidatus Heimdallarchaeota archaeon]|nr:zinc ribbon domain-containing protein [Candidatus Heimdallarchaeota archaeon]MCK5049609.1 zinc ribbon domain-containing protein [Candidatus Heimdallarchaeota archaeon]
MSEDMIKCPSCGELNYPSDECLFCGSSLSSKEAEQKEASELTENEIVCPNCFSMNSSESKTCSSCGMGLEPSEVSEDEDDLSFDLPVLPSLDDAPSYVTDEDASAALPSLPDFDFLAPTDGIVDDDLYLDADVEVKPSFVASIGLYGSLVWGLVFFSFVTLSSLGSIGFVNPNITFRGEIFGLEEGLTVDPIGLIYSLLFFIIFGWHTRYRWEMSDKAVNFPIYSILTLLLAETITLFFLLIPLPFLASSSELLYVFLILS